MEIKDEWLGNYWYYPKNHGKYSYAVVKTQLKYPPESPFRKDYPCESNWILFDEGKHFVVNGGCRLGHEKLKEFPDLDINTDKLCFPTKVTLTRHGWVRGETMPLKAIRTGYTIRILTENFGAIAYDYDSNGDCTRTDPILPYRGKLPEAIPLHLIEDGSAVDVELINGKYVIYENSSNE